MFIVNKSKDMIINTDHMIDVYADRNCIIVALSGLSKTLRIADYKSETETGCAMSYLVSRLSSDNKVIYMLDDDQIKGILSGNNRSWHHATGKKPKGHGGS